jgi:BirA family biotin operon repressor/biotin-[acetyl-CoA-carboxylase] ligase
LLAFEALGFSAFAQRFAQRDALRDQALVLSDGKNPPTQGTGCGVDEQGALLVLTPQGMHTVHSADVSVRPVGGDTP